MDDEWPIRSECTRAEHKRMIQSFSMYLYRQYMLHLGYTEHHKLLVHSTKLPGSHLRLLRRLLADKHVGDARSELLAGFVDVAKEAIAGISLAFMVPLFVMFSDLVRRIGVQSEQGVNSLGRLRSLRVTEVRDILVDQDRTFRHGLGVLKNTKFANVRTREDLHEPVELGADGVGTFGDPDGVMEDGIRRVNMVSRLLGIGGVELSDGLKDRLLVFFGLSLAERAALSGREAGSVLRVRVRRRHPVYAGSLE